ncbi:glycosyltransferase [Sphingomonas sp. CCH5-D11]|uniref:glycosyltransferase n=1 Tax=Sphingomonas sp. CCH5-D11 TaxID=1768786 RepID=UPI000AB961D7|nr:glycosyltransferase [Sphingomonas sp. CCH5-D11]
MTHDNSLKPAGGSIAHFTTSLDIGGAQAMLRKLIEHSDMRRDALSHAIVSLLPPGIFSPVGTPCPVYSLYMPRGGRPTIPSLMRLFRISNRLRPEILQGWMYHGNLAASLASMVRSDPGAIVWNVRHSLSDPALESRKTRALLALSSRLSSRTSAILYNSQTSARQHERYGFDPERTVVIPNGFDCATYKPDRERRALLQKLFAIPDGRTCVAVIGRHHPMKDHVSAVEAARRVIESGRNIHLLLVGPGMDNPSPGLRDALALLPRHRFTLVGERTDVADWLPGVDILALSSAWGEAFPNILGEAMACGVPCVATDIGDSAFVLGDTGLAVPPRSPEALSEAINRMCDGGEAELAERGGAARRRIEEHFELGEITRQYRRLYQSILRGSRTAPRPTDQLPSQVRAALP